jgi:hypothetical protein
LQIKLRGKYRNYQDCRNVIVVRPTIVLFLLLIAVPLGYAQGGHPLQLNSPYPNQEICLGDSLDIAATIRNLDTVPRTLVAFFRIRNAVTGIRVDSMRDTIYNVAAGASTDTTFGKYRTNPNVLSQLGTFYASLTLLALDSTNRPIEKWPFRDSIAQRMFGIRRTSSPYRDPSNNYSHTPSANIPDQTLWVSYGATVVDGDSETWDPPPPRDKDGLGYGAMAFRSPVMRFDRRNENGVLYAGSGVGDTLTTFPINLRGQTHMLFGLDFMRSGKRAYPASWDKDTMFGPEQTIRNYASGFIRQGDSLIVEFSDPAGSECNSSAWDQILGIDGGHDFEFKHLNMEIRRVGLDSIALAYHLSGDSIVTKLLNKNYIDSNFRFRLRLKANDNASLSGHPRDDEDPWYIDNPHIFRPSVPELAISWVRIVTPYTKVPRSEAILPVYVNILNTGYYGWSIPVRIDILRPSGDTVYSQVMDVNYIGASADTIVTFPSWDAREETNSKSGPYTIVAKIADYGFDNYGEDNETYSTFFLNVEDGPNAIQEFALDDAGLTPLPGLGNDIPKLTGVAGSGIGFGKSQGSLGIRFQLLHRDSVAGVRLFFGSNNRSPDEVQVDILSSEDNSDVPLENGHEEMEYSFISQRDTSELDQFHAYYFPKPIALPGGTHWVAVSQLAHKNMELGGTLMRGGGLFQYASQYSITPIVAGSYGTQWGPNPSDNSGDISSLIAVDSPVGYGWWQAWMSDHNGWAAMRSLDQVQPTWTFADTTSWTNAGTYIPSIRVIVGQGAPSSSISPSTPHDSSFICYPNPVTFPLDQENFNFSLTEISPVSLTVYDAMGREVCTLVRGVWEQGPHVVHWNGRSSSGKYVASGTYVCRLSAGVRSAATRIIVVR